MQKISKKSGKLGIMFLVMLLFFSASVMFRSTAVSAAVKNGFVKEGSYTYYYKNGKKITGWLTLNGKKYYFYSGSGRMATGYVKNSTGQKRYFYKNTGVMATGFVVNSTKKTLYFDPKTGYMKVSSWLTENGKKRYFDKNGYMTIGWLTNSKGQKRYFYNGSGYMATGLVKASNGQFRYFDPTNGFMKTGYVSDSKGTRYFYSKNGLSATGWVKNTTGNERYFDPQTGYYFVNTTVNIDGMICTFNSKGYCTSKGTGVTLTAPSSARTLKNYLAGALIPVGQALYVWGGGWNDATRKGLNPQCKEWYDMQSSSYDFNNYRDLSSSTRAKGFDCSGFVGWAAYQVMQTKSGVGSGYTVVSGDVGPSYKRRGWGTILTQSDLAASDYKFVAGDVGYNDGHTWIVLGQCADKSLVIIHSTNNAGVQIAGTPKPDGNYSSQAITLAKKYMSKYPGYTKYKYNTSSGHYIRNGNYLRWNRTTLSDPDGYANKTADQILADLFK
ncbi:MAG: N-acetylmuramoyl-L-alanine amidase family protein [Clostridiales bacterium]|nr:N-acetylmuramoyl-L-alanine amidase family protein [Candidatus Blautia equi]